LITVDFENFLDSDLLVDQLVDLTMANTIVYSAGISLNEFEFPPFSGTNVVSDFGGPIKIQFATPVPEVWAYFTYLVPLSLVAYDVSNSVVATTKSTWGNNTAVSGDPGSIHNEKLLLNGSKSIYWLIITGNIDGGSFVLDDLTFDYVPSTLIPEPGTFFRAALALLLLAVWRKQTCVR